MRYILALIPPKEQRFLYIKAAQQVFSSITDGYLLADGISMPHITIGSFQCDDSKIAEICDDVQKWKINNCAIRFIGLLLKKGKIPANHYSIGLSVARDATILQLHQSGLDVFQNHKITSLNPNKDLYQPHLTLAGISWHASEIVSLPAIIDDLISTSIDPFHLVLGKGDDIGQYLETLFEF